MFEEEVREKRRRPKRRVLGQPCAPRSVPAVSYLISAGEVPSGMATTTVLLLELPGMTHVQLTRLKSAGVIAPVANIKVRTTGRPTDVWEIAPTITAIRDHQQATGGLKAVA